MQLRCTWRTPSSALNNDANESGSDMALHSTAPHQRYPTKCHGLGCPFPAPGDDRLQPSDHFHRDQAGNGKPSLAEACKLDATSTSINWLPEHALRPLPPRGTSLSGITSPAALKFRAEHLYTKRTARVLRRDGH
jgi:hypothetical protein